MIISNFVNKMYLMVLHCVGEAKVVKVEHILNLEELVNLLLLSLAILLKAHQLKLKFLQTDTNKT